MRQTSFVKSTSSMAEKAMHQSTSVTILNVRIYSCELHWRHVQTTRVQNTEKTLRSAIESCEE